MTSSEFVPDVGNWVAFLIPGVAIPLVLLVLAFLQPTKRQVSRWAAVCGVTLTESNRGHARAHLARVRRFRSIAALPFWWLAWAPFVYPRFPGVLASPFPAMAAYLAGALVAEVTGGAARVPATAERQAPLLTRTMDDYGPHWARKLPYLLLATAMLTVVLAGFLNGAGSINRAAIVIALATAFAAGALLVSHMIVRRPQRGAEPDVLAIDDALRATGISTAYAAATLSGLLATWTGMGSLMPDRVRDWWLLLVVAGWFATCSMAIGLWTIIVRQETWRYRLRHRQRAATIETATAVPS